MGDYTKLSTFMGRWPEMTIFRQYGSLNVQNILYLQAELAYLEDELSEMRKEDKSSGDPEKQGIHKIWRRLSDLDIDGKPCAQYAKVLEIREKLREYNEAIIQYHGICQINKPTKTNLNSLRHWLDSKHGGNCFLSSFEADAWEKDRPDLQADLISMSDKPNERDVFSAWVADDIVAWAHRTFGHWQKTKISDVEGGMSAYSDTKLAAMTHFIGTLVASLLPAMSIFVLYFLHDMLTRLGVILAFSALFSFTLAIFTRAKRIEIFAATAAYVFILFTIDVVLVLFRSASPSGDGTLMNMVHIASPRFKSYS